MGKLIDLNKERRKRKPRSPEEVAQAAYRRFCAPEVIAALPDEPSGIASGKTALDGSFIRDDEDDRLADLPLNGEQNES